MILVDTSVWAQHIDRHVSALTAALDAEQVLIHPFVIGELAMGNLRQRGPILSDLQDLPKVIVASDQETLDLIERGRLFGIGIGYVDAHLLAAALLSVGTSLWTFDKRLDAAAARLGISHQIGS